MHTVSQLVVGDPKATRNQSQQLAAGASKEDEAAFRDMDAQTMPNRKPADDDSQHVQGLISSVVESNEVRAAVLSSIAQSGQGRHPAVEVEITLTFPSDLASIAEGAHRVEQLLAKIKALCSLPADFDGEGAAPVSTAAVQAAGLLVNDLYWVHGLVCDHAAPLADGGVELEFEGAWVYFNLWVHDYDSVQFIVNRGGLSKHGSGALYEVRDALWKAIA